MRTISETSTDTIQYPKQSKAINAMLGSGKYQYENTYHIKFYHKFGKGSDRIGAIESFTINLVRVLTG